MTADISIHSKFKHNVYYIPSYLIFIPVKKHSWKSTHLQSEIKKHINKLTIEKTFSFRMHIPTYGFQALGDSVHPYKIDHALDTKDGQLLYGLGPDRVIFVVVSGY